MKSTKNILKFFLSTMLLTLAFGFAFTVLDSSVGTSLARFTPLVPVIKTAVQFVPALNILPMGALGDAAIVSVFARDIEENIFPKNEFYKRSKDDTSMIVEMNGALYVVYGTAGLRPNVEEDRQIYPKPLLKRTDDSNQYRLSHLSTDAIHIQSFEEFIVNYNKRANVLSDHIDELNTTAAEILANIWLPDGVDNIVRTSSSNTRTASAPSATGTRKRIDKADFIKCAEVFNRMDVPVQDRFAVIPAEFLSDLLLIDGFVEADKIGKANLVEGTIGRLLGFNIYMRSSVGRYDNEATPVKKDRKAAGAATDNLAALFWYEKWVNRAEGNVKVMADENNPLLDGGAFSAESWVGGKTRKDKKGVLALVETAG